MYCIDIIYEFPPSSFHPVKLFHLSWIFLKYHTIQCILLKFSDDEWKHSTRGRSKSWINPGNEFFLQVSTERAPALELHNSDERLVSLVQKKKVLKMKRKEKKNTRSFLKNFTTSASFNRNPDHHVVLDYIYGCVRHRSVTMHDDILVYWENLTITKYENDTLHISNKKRKLLNLFYNQCTRNNKYEGNK